MKKESYNRYRKTKRWQGKRRTIMNVLGINFRDVKRDLQHKCIIKLTNVSVANDSATYLQCAEGAISVLRKNNGYL